ncbi:MAG: hypothetical protein QM753_04925 [Thermomicrobiales bacterium]
MRQLADPEPEGSLEDPMVMFLHDLIDDEREFAIMQDPERIAVFEVRPKTYRDERVPDIETRRTKAYVVGWELRKDHPTLPQR